MKTLILYATKYGATLKIAENISQELGEAILRDIDSKGTISLDDFDCVILGSSLTAGTINKKLKDFAVKHKKELKSKRLGLFVSGLMESEGLANLEKNFPSELTKSAKSKTFLGGIFDPQKTGFIARTVMKKVAKLENYTSTINQQEIRAFVGQLVRN